jgi:hypothetical protein
LFIDNRVQDAARGDVVAADIRLGLELAKKKSASMVPINKTTPHGSV